MAKGSYTWDLSGIERQDHRSVIQGALDACDYPFGRIRRKTGKKVPVTVADTSRFSASHGSEDHDSGVHALNDPADHRRATLGLFWLPTDSWPAGQVEVSDRIMGDVPLAQEVFLAEAAHAVDYGAMTDAQREAIWAIVHRGDSTPHGTHGWFEERGGNNYWADWVGETFMSLFMRAFAPKLPRPLEARQPWVHKVDGQMALQARRVLRAR